jgi:hypothetical protein
MMIIFIKEEKLNAQISEQAARQRSQGKVINLFKDT